MASFNYEIANSLLHYQFREGYICHENILFWKVFNLGAGRI